jgi:hypothetical protein
VEGALGAFNELYSKYKYMENSFLRSKNIYKSKLPEIEQTLELIKILQSKKEAEETLPANYSLCDTIYAKATVRSPSICYALPLCSLRTSAALLLCTSIPQYALLSSSISLTVLCFAAHCVAFKERGE